MDSSSDEERGLLPTSGGQRTPVWHIVVRVWHLVVIGCLLGVALQAACYRPAARAAAAAAAAAAGPLTLWKVEGDGLRRAPGGADKAATPSRTGPSSASSRQVARRAGRRQRAVWMPRKPANRTRAHGYTFVGHGNVAGLDAPCNKSEALYLPGGLGDMCQPGNVTVDDCRRACTHLHTCTGFTWMLVPEYSPYRECYFKQECHLSARFRGLDGAVTWQRDGAAECKDSGWGSRELLELYGEHPYEMRTVYRR